MRAPDRRSTRRDRARTLLALGTTAWAALAVAACGWDPRKPFDRESPAVSQAIVALDAGDASAAAKTLEDYLLTGQCKEGSIGTPPLVRQRPSGGFDLGLSLFRVGEAFGRRFGDEERGDLGAPGAQPHGAPPRASGDDKAEDDARQHRAAHIQCALQIVQAIAADESQPVELRARSRYLEGNLDFLGTDYEAAVTAYDQALTLSPGVVDAGDPIGRDAAWNRAIALRRIEDKKDAGNDASSPDASGDAASDGSRGDAATPDSGGGDGGNDASPSAPDASDSGKDSASPPPPPDDAAPPPPPPPRANQDERILDQLENAPTVQQEDAKKRATKHRVRGTEDK